MSLRKMFDDLLGRTPERAVQSKTTDPDPVLDEWRKRDATVRVHARAERTVAAYRREAKALRH